MLKKSSYNRALKNNNFKGKKALDLTVFMTSSVVIGRLLSIPSSIIVAKILNPVGFGVFAIIGLIIKYAGYFDFGALKCIARNATIAMGEGNVSKANQIKDTIFTSMCITTIIPIIILWILYALNISFDNVLSLPILIMISLILISNKLIAFFKSSAIADGEFYKFAFIDLIDKVLTPISSITLVLMYGLHGILLGMLFVNIIKLIYLHFFYKKKRTNFFFNLNKIINQLKTGVFLYSIGLFESFLLGIGVILTKKFLMQDEVGIYAFASGIIMSKSIPFSGPINMLLSRKIFFDKGKDKKVKIEPSLLGKYFTIYLFFHSAVIGSIYLLFNYIVFYFLNDYSQSLPIMLMIFTGYIIYISQNFFKFLLDASDKLGWILKNYILGLSFTLLLSIILFGYKNDIKSIAISCTIGLIIVALSMHQNIFYLFKMGRVKGFIFSLKVVLLSLLLTYSLFKISNYNLIQIENSMVLWKLILSNIIECFFKIITYIFFNLLCYFVIYPKVNLINEVRLLLKMYYKK